MNRSLDDFRDLFGGKAPAQSRQLLRTVLIALLSLGLTAVLSLTPMFRDLHRFIVDAEYRLTAAPLNFDNIAVIDIDESSLIALESQLGAWPYDRDIYAFVAEYLIEAGARQIGFDILLSEARYGDDQFSALIRKHPQKLLFAIAGSTVDVEREDRDQRLAGIQTLDLNGGLTAPAWRSMLTPSAELSVKRAGVITIQSDDDGVLRRTALVHEHQNRHFPSLSLAMALGPDEPPAASFREDMLEAAGFHWPVDDSGAVRLKIPQSLDALQIIPFYQLIINALDARDQGADSAGSHFYRGKDILIGSSATVLGDYATLPYLGRASGLSVQAMHLAALQGSAVLRPPLPWLDLLLCALTLLICSAAPLLRRNQSSGGSHILLGTTVAALLAYGLHLLLLLSFDQLSTAAFPILLAVITGVLMLGERANYLNRFRYRLIVERNAAEQANQLKSHFLATITHELRTPLAAIEGYNRLLDERDDLSADDRRQYHHLVHQGARNLLLLINNLLDQSRLEAGQLEIEPATVDVRDMLATTVDLLRPLAEDKGLYLRLEVMAAVPKHVIIDGARVRQIVINLIGNAIKFTREGGTTVNVNWSHGQLQVDVDDTGPGIPEDSLQRIFDAFKQSSAQDANHSSGTGLGLSISRNLVHLMGGEITVENRRKTGSRFRFQVPAPEDTAAANKGDQQPIDQRQFSGERGLIIDDNDELRHLIGLYLSSWDLTVLEARDAESGRKMALETSPELILLDLLLPDGSGHQVASQLRASGYAGRIIALSAHAAKDEMDAAQAAGCDGYLQKPVEPLALKQLIAEQLDQR